MDAWKYEKGVGMSPDAAYSTLDVPAETDDGMLLTIYSLRVCLLVLVGVHFPRALISPLLSVF